MSNLYDQVALTLGHPLPKAIDYLMRILWWPLFILSMASLWPSAYPLIETWFAGHGLAVVLPSGLVVIPALALLTGFLLEHARMVRRRITLATGASHGS